jgi:hypothetical protein
MTDSCARCFQSKVYVVRFFRPAFSPLTAIQVAFLAVLNSRYNLRREIKKDSEDYSGTSVSLRPLHQPLLTDSAERQHLCHE